MIRTVLRVRSKNAFGVRLRKVFWAYVVFDGGAPESFRSYRVVDGGIDE